VIRVAALAGTALVVFTALARAVTPTPASSVVTGAQAAIVRVTVPGHEPVSLGAISWPASESAEVQSFSYPDDGSIVQTSVSSANVSAQRGQAASAQANVDAIAVSLFGGDIVASHVTANASVGATLRSTGADVSSSSVQGLQVLGQNVPATRDSNVALGGWGTLQVLTGSQERRRGGVRSAQAEVDALRLRLTAPHGGLPSGSQIVVGAASAVAVAEAPAPLPAGATRAGPGATSRSNAGPGATYPPPPEAGGAGVTIPGGPVRAPPVVKVKPTFGGYVFPVFGTASFGDSFGAPRPDLVSGWHHGEDIFAPLGAPVLAVTDGTLYSIGWNRIGGYRLWLRDRTGNQFYYAHLSAYSSLAVEGGQVHAGDVIAFVGDTGDADGGPPHLHFEIHPAAILGLGYDGVIAPYPYLVAWRRERDVSFAAGRVYVPSGPGPGVPRLPSPGAILLQADDIASASGLVPGALEKALSRSPAP
jgi:murein DD-endopeptidase MepM/ murein hydrolase activator NlpD